jgi:hypothetical protein
MNKIKQHTREFYNTYGDPGEHNLVIVSVPYKLRLSWDITTRIDRIRVHRLVSDEVPEVLEKVYGYYGKEVFNLGIDTFGGSYNFRKTRRGNDLSMHAWGLALDFDPLNNRLQWGEPRARFSEDVYQYWWEQWEAVGWTSLGRELNYDWMHIQKPSI